MVGEGCLLQIGEAAHVEAGRARAACACKCTTTSCCSALLSSWGHAMQAAGLVHP